MVHLRILVVVLSTRSSTPPSRSRKPWRSGQRVWLGSGWDPADVWPQMLPHRKGQTWPRLPSSSDSASPSDPAPSNRPRPTPLPDSRPRTATLDATPTVMPLHALPLRLSESTRRAGIDIDTSLHEAVGSDVPLRTLQPATRPPLLLVSSPASSSSSAFASASSSRPPSSPLGFPSSPATDPSSYASDAGTGPDAYQHLPSKLRLRKLKAEGKLRQQQKAPAASGKENVDSVTSSSKRAPGAWTPACPSLR